MTEQTGATPATSSPSEDIVSRLNKGTDPCCKCGVCAILRREAAAEIEAAREDARKARGHLLAQGEVRPPNTPHAGEWHTYGCNAGYYANYGFSAEPCRQSCANARLLLALIGRAPKSPEKDVTTR